MKITGENLETVTIDASDDMPPRDNTNVAPEFILPLNCIPDDVDWDGPFYLNLYLENAPGDELRQYWDPETKLFKLPCKWEINEEHEIIKFYPILPEKE